ncbi:MAG: heparan-alpha-glucosaminide N-acetyltransferase [Candidatus Aenigmatarchaeota archaeon]
MEKRFWEIDFLRGFAVVMMIIYHLFFDLSYFGYFNINSAFWWWLAHVIATIFIFLVGISLSLSFSRTKKIRMPTKEIRKKYLRRGLKIFSLGMIITLITWIFMRKGFVLFGVLHLIGVSIILAYPFLKLRFPNLILGITFISLGLYMKNFTFDFPWLLWAGFMPHHFYTIDYFPILPWFGVVLIGLFFGNLLYPNYQRIVNLPEDDFITKRFFCFLGRNSLPIYLLHQPILITILYFLIV